MDLQPRHRLAKIKAVDELTLEAWLYESEDPAMPIVITHGARRGSEGLPRNQIDPSKMIEDISGMPRVAWYLYVEKPLLSIVLDVVSFAAALPSVDPRRIALWGMSFGAAVSGVAAAINRRVAAVLIVCPLFSYIRADRRAAVSAQLIKDRKSQLRGNEAFTTPPFNNRGENPAGFAGAGGAGGSKAYTLMKAAAEHGHPNFRDRFTFQTYHKFALFRPKALLVDFLEGTPTMMIIPELDEMSPPAEQRDVFESLHTPKQLHLAIGKEHLSVLDGEGSLDLRAIMVNFFMSALAPES
ncbi:alpha/beta-hydrolase [Xylaria venustula]|nr:alpha/beta-hydrolase [Xylaria venustula]